MKKVSRSLMVAAAVAAVYHIRIAVESGSKSNPTFTTVLNSTINHSNPNLRTDSVEFLDDESYRLALEAMSLSTNNAQNDVINNRYEKIAYGQFLVPYNARKPQMKMLQIGSACDDSLGASIDFWRNLLPYVDLSVSLHSGDCVEISKEGGGGLDDEVTILSSGQDLAGYNFDVVVDTVGQGTCQSVSSIENIWPIILPGGLYFIENIMSTFSSQSCGNDKKNLTDWLKAQLDDTVHMDIKEGEPSHKFFFCQQDACVVGKNGTTLTNFGDNDFVTTAKALRPTTDKVKKHRYNIMYGQFLLPYYWRKPHTKMLEIGLGCDMRYGPGASVSLYRMLFPQMEKWEAEYNGDCVKKSQERGELDGFNVLVGDQADISTLDKWIEESGGANFDVVIDDGGHTQCQIWTTFQKLWPRLLSGGLYFIEDLEVSRHHRYQGNPTILCQRGTNVVDLMKDKLVEVVHGRQKDVQFIFCQQHACMLRKK